MNIIQSCPTLCDSMDYTVHGVFQARILEWVAFLFSRGIFPPQGRNPGLPRCRQILYQLSHKGSPCRKQCRRPGFNPWVRKIHWRRDRLPTPVFLGFPCGSAGKESACSAGDMGSIPGLGRSPGEGKGYPLQCSGLENSMDCIVHGVAKSWTRLSDFHFTFQKSNKMI